MKCRHIESDGLAVCPNCSDDVLGSGGVLFEGSEKGVVERFITTTQSILFRPSHFARNLNLEGALGPALRFGLASILIGQLALLFWFLLLVDDTSIERIAELAAQAGMTVKGFQLLHLSTLPIFAVLRVVVFALLLQVGVLLSGADRSFKYRDYVRLFCYASASYMVLILVPLVFGMIITVGYMLVICGHALRYHHRLSNGQTFVAIAPLAVGMMLFELTGGF
jgi:hypothetical protein